MLRKSISLALKPIFRPYPLNSLKCAFNNLTTSSVHWNNKKSVLADPGTVKPDTPDKFQLQSALTLQQTEKLYEIQKLRSPQDVLTFLKSNSNLIVPLHAPLFAQIFEMMESNNFGITAEKFTSSIEFENFCKSVKKSARALRPSDILTILKTLRLMKISTNSLLSQTLLNVLSKTINELHIGQLIYINFIIREAPSSPIVEALRIAIPIVFEANVRSKLSYGYPKPITEALCYALNIHASFKTIDLIVDAALDVRDQFTFNQCKDIVIGFLFNKVKFMVGSRKQFYSFCMAKVNEEMEENFKFNDIFHLSSLIVNSFLYVNSFYYDEVFLDKVIKHVIANNMGLVNTGKLMRVLNRISYVDFDLINYVDVLLSQVADLEKMPDGVTTVLAHISTCSDARYLPPNWNTYEQKMIDYFMSMEDINIPLVRIVLELIALDRWHIPLINKVLDEHFLRQYLDRKLNKLDHFNVLNLYQAVATSKKHDIKVTVPRNIIETAIEHQISLKEEHLAPSLELLFGGKSYVVNRILTKYGHFIDHLIVMNKNGEPLPIRDEKTQDGGQLENIALPENGYAFAVILLFPTSYCIDGVRLRGKFKLGIDSLATQGVIPVPVSLTVWESLHDSEKLPYLQREIFSRIPGNDSYQSSKQVF